MTTLVPMQVSFFENYLHESIEGYAQQSVSSGRWLADDAQRRSHAEHEKLLPQGLATTDHFLFEIRHEHVTVGTLWVAITIKAEERTAYIYNIQIYQQYQRQGHARRAFAELKDFVRSLGLSTIELHVFAHNTGAQALYESLGYVVTGVNMQLNIDTVN